MIPLSLTDLDLGKKEHQKTSQKNTLIKTSNTAKYHEILAPVSSIVILLLRPDFHYLQLLITKGKFYHKQERQCKN